MASNHVVWMRSGALWSVCSLLVHHVHIASLTSTAGATHAGEPWGLARSPTRAWSGQTEDSFVCDPAHHASLQTFCQGAMHAQADRECHCGLA